MAGEPAAYPEAFGLGAPIPESEWAALLTAIPPTGAGLPQGQGTSAEGQLIYAQKCASCHGSDLQGTAAGLRLIGGRGTLTSQAPVKSVESFWPYAPSVFSYIRNTMPTDAPGALENSEVYALVAFILAQGGVIDSDAVVDANTLPLIVMPNREGFIADPRPDIAADE
jgi:cytochrome c